MPVTISGSTGISGVDGSAGTPALIGSDADTGLFFNAGFLNGSSNGVAGRIPSMQLFRLNADLAGANVNTAQSVFGVGVTLAGSTVYAFEAIYVFSKSAGTTSHSFGFGFGGTSTLNNIIYATSYGQLSSSTPAGSDAAAGFFVSNTAANTTATAGTTTANNSRMFIVRGTVSINAGGTFIPQYTLSAAPGGAYSTVAGSYFAIYPLSASGANTSIGSWS